MPLFSPLASTFNEIPNKFVVDLVGLGYPSVIGRTSYDTAR